jgi:hypothetical protein
MHKVMSAEIFQIGLEVEFEHVARYPEANVTNNHPILTGKNRFSIPQRDFELLSTVRNGGNRRGPFENSCK